MKRNFFITMLLVFLGGFISLGSSVVWADSGPVGMLQSVADQMISGLKAHQATQKENASDDCALALEAGHSVFIAQGSEENIKITTPFDLKVAEQMVKC